MIAKQGSLLGTVAGVILGLGITLALGAVKAPAPASPHYSVQYIGVVTFITDNETNKLYMYENEDGRSRLKAVLDLSKTGETELVAIKSGEGKN